MNEPHNERRHYSPSATIVEQSRLLPTVMALAIVNAFMAGAALAVSGWAIYQARLAEREARILKINVDGYEKALALHGIDHSGHLPGEPK